MRRVVVFVCALALMGCASLLSAKQEQVLINTDPPGATVLLDGEPRGVTPLEVVISPTKTYALMLAKDGYAPYQQSWPPTFGFQEWGPLAYEHLSHRPVSVTLRPFSRKGTR
jgi:hypothetical protein